MNALQANTLYYFKVAAYNVGGESAGLVGTSTTTSCGSYTTNTWQGTLTAGSVVDFNVAGSWSQGRVPNSCDNVVISPTTLANGTSYLYMNAPVSLHNLTIAPSNGTAGARIFVWTQGYNLSIGGDLNVSAGTTTTSYAYLVSGPGAITVQGDANLGVTGAGIGSFGSGGASVSPIYFKGNLTLGTRAFINGGGLLNFVLDGGSNQVFTNNNATAGNTDIGYFTIGSSATPSVTFAGTGLTTTRILSDLTLGAGASLNLPATYTLNRTAVGGTLTLGANSSLQLGGVSGGVGTSNFPSNFSTYTIDNNSTVKYSGATNQTLVATTYGKLIAANTVSLTLNGNTTVSNSFTLTSGKIITGSNTLSLAAAATFTGGSSSSYVFGNLQKGISSATTTKTFEIGDADYYTPVKLDFIGGSTNSTGNLKVSTTSGAHPQLASSGLDVANYLGRYWTVVNSGVTGYTSINPTFNYDANDFVGASTNSAFKIANYYNSGWGINTTTVPSSVSNKATGLILSSGTTTDFAIGNLAALPAPTVNDPSATPVCEGSTVTVSGSNFTGVSAITIGAVNVPTYTVNSTTSITITIPLSAAPGGQIFITNSGGTGNSSSSLNVNQQPQTTVSPSSQTICSGDAITTIVLGNSDNLSGVTYSWTRVGGSTGTNPTSGTANISGTLVNADAVSDVNTYTVSSSLNGCAGSTAIATVTVKSSPGTISISPSSATLCQSTVQSLAATVVAATGTSTGTNSTSTSITVTTGVSVTSNIAISDIPTGAVITAISVSLNASTQRNSDFTYNLIAPNGKVLNLINQRGASTNTGAGLTNVVVSSTGVTSFSTTDPSAGTYAADAAQSISVSFPSNALSFADLYSVTNGTWKLGAANAALSTRTGSITSWSISISYKLSPSISWTPTTGLFSDAGFTAYTGTNLSTVYAKGVTNTYSAVATFNGCTVTSSNSAAITVNPTPVATATNSSQTICSGSSIASIVFGTSNSVSGTTFNWTRTTPSGISGIASSGSSDITGSLTNSTSSPITVTFTITPTSPSSCAGTAITASITVKPVPVISITPTSQTICSGNSITALALSTSNSVSGTSYNWTRDNTTTVTSASDIAASATGNTGSISGKFTNTTSSGVTVTFTITPVSSGCYGTSSTATVLVNPTLTLSAISGASSVCVGSSTTYTNAIPGGTWSSGNTLIATVDNSGNVTSIATGSIPIRYTLAVAGCPSQVVSKTLAVNAYVNPSVTVSASTTTVCSVGSATFTASPTFGGTSPVFNFKVNGSTGQNSTSATYTKTGFTEGDIVTVQITSNYACLLTTTATSSNSVTMHTLTSTTWTGAANTNWNNASNWSCVVPLSTYDAVIPASVSSGNYPILTSNVTLNNLSNSSFLSLGGYSLTLNGTLTGTGSIKGSSTSSLVLNSSSTPTLYFNAAANDSLLSTLTINGSGGAKLGSNLAITRLLSVNAGNFNLNNKILTLKSSSIANSAIVGPIASGSAISGTVTVERYIPKGFRGYRDIAAGVANAGSMFNNWQEAGASTSGTGIFITGEVGTSKGFNATTGIDYSSNGLNPASYFNNSVASSNWTTITNTKNITLDPYQPYRVLVRGDRSFDMFTVLPILGTNGNLGMVNATAIRATGKLITGNVEYSTSGVINGVYNSSASKLNGSSTSAFSAVANPYVCPVDLTQVSATGIEGNGTSINKFYYFDPTFSSTGTYVTVLDGITTPIQSKVTTILQPGQSIFVRNNASTTPTITFTESAKATSTTPIAIFGANTVNRMDFTLLRKLPSDSIYSFTDGAVAVFKTGKSNGYSSNEDAAKLNNANDNISIVHGNVNLSIDGRPLATANDSIVLKLGALSTKNYQLQVDGSSFAANGLTAYLYDAYLKSTTALTAGVNKVNFTVDNTIAASYVNRFGVVFKPTAPLSVKAIYASATLKNEIATINWTTQGEEKVATYTVEKSTDAKNFNKVGEVVVAKNSITASYSAIDKNIANGTTYYRIRATNVDGSLQYSNIAKLSTYNLELSTYNLYPNPLKGKALTVQMNNVATGKYTVVIYNALGQKVLNQVVVHEGGMTNHAINIGTQLSAGVYTVSILGSEGKVSETKLSVE